MRLKVLEKVIGLLMLVFAVSSVFIFYASLKAGLLPYEIAIIEILLILVLAVLAQTVVLLRIYERHV